ncbi:MAG: hypothetical protein GY773_04415 [Actinomycetia bacterium]|nr:hypothetical protein [Actinomycetes bacterium]
MKDLNKSKPKTCGSAVQVPAGSSAGLLVIAVGALGIGTLWNRRRRTPATLPV